MNLMSHECGAVLDKDKLPFPEDIYDEEGGVVVSLAQWDGYDWVPACKCPVCKEPVRQNAS